jgi:Flp pilus assembly pilin Flp
MRNLRRRALHDESGAASLEYLVVASAIIVLVGCLAVGGGQRTVSNGFATLFCKVQQAVGGGGTCSVPASASNADYKPTCQISSSAVNVKVTVKVFSGVAGKDTKMTTTYNSDGTVKHVIKQNASGTGTDSVVATTSLELDTPEKQAVFQQWNDGLSVGQAAGSAWDAIWSDPGSDANDSGGAFGKLLVEQGKTSVVTYDGTVVNYGGGVEAAAGIKFGADAGVGMEDSKATSAHYLGAPDSAGNREVVAMPDCVPK